MKFPYLKLTLLLAALFVMPQAMKAQADVEGAAKLLLELTNTQGEQRTVAQTIGTIDEIILKLDNDEYYAETISALGEFKSTLEQFRASRAKGVFERIQNQLVEMKEELSEETKAEVDQRLKKLNKQSEVLEVLNHIGIHLTATDVALDKAKNLFGY